MVNLKNPGKGYMGIINLEIAGYGYIEDMAIANSCACELMLFIYSMDFVKP